MIRTTVFILLLGLLSPATAGAQVFQKISTTEGDFTGAVDAFDSFGQSVASLGDLDGDGITDLAVGAWRDGDGGVNRGAVWVLFLNQDGTVKDQQKISDTAGGFTGQLDDNDQFGVSIASLGDLDGDGITDLAVGAWFDGDGGAGRGAVWVLFLNQDGTVKNQQKISDTAGGFTGQLDDAETFGSSVASLGDLDGDGITDLAVGASRDGGLDVQRGAVWVLFLNQDGTVKDHQKISNTTGGFTGQLDAFDIFGQSVASLGDLDGDGITDLAVGVRSDDDGGGNRGAVWVLFLNQDGTVKDQQKISSTAGGFTGRLDNGNHFGSSVASLGDLDGDGVTDLAVGAPDLIPLPPGPGAVWVLFLNPEGTVKAHRQISNAAGSFDGPDQIGLGAGVASLGDFNDDGFPVLALGTPLDNDGGRERGAVWLFSLASLLTAEIQPLGVQPERPALSQDLQITARITDFSGTGLSSTQLHFRRAGDPFFFSVDMQAQTPVSYSFTIPASLLTSGSVEYFITATNGLGSLSRLPASGFFSQPIYLSDGLETPLVHGTEATAYRLISIPLDLDDKDARTMLEDDLGPYDNTRWRFFTHQGGQQLRELDQSTIEMVPGRAFWLLINDPNPRLTTGPGTSIPTEESFSIPLFQGWSLVGSPFNYSLSLSQLRLQSGQRLDVRRYDGAWHAVDSVLVPFEGYAIFNGETFIDTLLIDPNVSEVQTSAPRHTAKAEVLSWSIDIKARQGQARDIDTRAAVSGDASPGWDVWDRPEPPVMGDYVSVSFPHPAWQHNTTRYSLDARPMPLDGEQWDVEIRTRRPGRVTMRFEGVETVPPEFEVWVVDEVLGTRQDLRLEPNYVVAGPGEGAVKRLALVVGRSSFVDEVMVSSEEVPARPVLFQNYPNPFMGATTIRYGLAEASAVHLAIYDMMGRHVATLVQREDTPGYHAVVWDGRSETDVPVGSGVYVVRMQAGEIIETQTMLLVK